MKPGYRTTEFWVALASSIFSFAAPLFSSIPAVPSLIGGAVISAAYAISRGLAKGGTASTLDKVAPIVSQVLQSLPAPPGGSK